MTARDKATDQLREFAECQRGKPEVLTTANGAPIGSKTAIMTAGARGPQVLQDFVFLDEMSHFGQERIPERVVHAKGAGAKGVFEVTKDISKYSKAKVFEVNKKTPLFVRFSTVGGERGSADTARDPRGFAIKMYTEEGNWDLVGNNTPIFFIRDPIFFPSFIHTQKRNPKTNLKDPDMFWDFISLRPETTHQVCFLFSDRGTPDGFRFMDGFGSHTFKLVNKRGEVHFCKFHLKTDQGIKNLPAETADKLQGTDPDYATRDLYNAIEDKNFPSWTFKIQVMTEKEAESVPFNPFDVTKTWSQTKYPLIEVGKLTLHTNPDNYHAEVEQAAFSPAHMPPGIEASPDKMLQGRLFSYSDTHRHRLGTNYQQIPVNQPRCQLPHTYQRDGPQTFLHMGGAPNYFPNSFGGADHDAQFLESSFKVSAEVKRYETRDEDNFSQVTVFWEKVLDEAARNRLVNNIAGSLVEAQEFIRKRAVSNFAQVHRDFGKKLESRLDELLSHKKAAKL